MVFVVVVVLFFIIYNHCLERRDFRIFRVERNSKRNRETGLNEGARVIFAENGGKVPTFFKNLRPEIVSFQMANGKFSSWESSS